MTDRKSKVESRKSHGAFTLFEVLVAIAIFMLLAGGIFGAVSAGFSASNQVVNSQLDAERLDAFQQFLRRLFVSLPADARIELKMRQASAGDVVEMRVWPVPPFMQFGPASQDGAAISAQPDGRGGFRMMLGYFSAEDTADEREEHLASTQWLMLLPGVQQLRWRFAPARNPVFEETWTAQSGRPGLAELALAMKDGGESAFQFWIPQLQRRSAGALGSGGGEGGENEESEQPSAPEDGGGGE